MDIPLAASTLLRCPPGCRVPPRCDLAVKRAGVPFTEHLLCIAIHRQVMIHFQIAHPRVRPGDASYGRPRYVVAGQCRISTSRFGVGQANGSRCTPLGLHRVAEKIGGGWPAGTVFKNRRPVGFTWAGLPNAAITSRILWLEGLEPGLNRGGRMDSHARYIYIHGTGDEPALGRPASCGCIHVATGDLLPLYDRVPVGTLVWIEL